MKQSIILRGSLSFAKRPGYYVQNVIDSIRSWFEGELIVSTWQNQIHDAKNLIGVDKIVISTDPGDGPLQQMQRQLNSYWAGVNACTGDQVMVTRTDILHFRDLFEFINTYPHHSYYDMRCFKHKLVIGNIMSISPNAYDDIPTFRPCDWFQVGYKEDIEKWCSITPELASIPKQILDDAWNNKKICTEKLWFTLVLNKFSKHKINWLDTTSVDHIAWEALLDNFVILDQITQARSINLNWAFQPQRMPLYITNETYTKKYFELCA